MASKETFEDKKNRITAIKVIGKGSFGMVYQGTYTDSSGVEKPAAIKRVYQDKRYKNRELEIMLSLSHPNIVNLYHHYMSEGEKDDEVYLNLVMELIIDTGYKVSKTFAKTNQRIPDILLKLYSYQLLRGIAIMHSKSMCHRDIKPQNLLIDNHTHRLVICDLGSAKQIIQGEPSVSYICSRYYRAPELIFGCTTYSTAIDVWSAGCVIAEFICGRPLFAGESGTDQLVEIMRLLGTPSKKQIKEMNPFFDGYKFPHVKVKQWNEVFKGTNEVTLNFLRTLVTYSPSDRPTAMQALTHEFFDEIKVQGAKLPNGVPVPDLFNWTLEEEAYYSKDIANIQPSWYRKAS